MRSMLHTRSQVWVLAAALALAGCSSTGIEESWMDPAAKTLPASRKVFVAYLGAEPSVQRVAEDAMAAHIHAPEVVRCYTLFPDARDLQPAEVTKRLRDQGFDAAVLMRLMGVEQEVSWTPSAYPAYYRSFGGYWGWGAPMDTGTLHTDRIVHVETNVYALAEDKLVYAARSEEFDPDSTQELVDDIAEDIAKDLESKGVLRAKR
jgi:hypothetical protein